MLPQAVDIRQNLLDKIKPRYTIPLNKGEEWQVREEPFNFDVPDKRGWKLTRSGDLVDIPLIPYRPFADSVLAATMFALDYAWRHLSDHKGRAIDVVFIVGDPVERWRIEADPTSDVEASEGYTIWLGVAVRTK